MFLMRNPLSSLFFVFPYTTCLFFPLVVFKIFSLSLVLSNLIMMYLGVVIFVFLVIEVSRIFVSVGL